MKYSLFCVDTVTSIHSWPVYSLWPLMKGLLNQTVLYPVFVSLPCQMWSMMLRTQIDNHLVTLCVINRFTVRFCCLILANISFAVPYWQKFELKSLVSMSRWYAMHLSFQLDDCIVYTLERWYLIACKTFRLQEFLRSGRQNNLSTYLETGWKWTWDTPIFIDRQRFIWLGFIKLILFGLLCFGSLGLNW